MTVTPNLGSKKSFFKYFSNTSWLMGEKILRIFAGLFVGVWVARYLGPDKYGILSYAHSFVGLFVILATFGLDNIVIRELVKGDSDKNKLLGTAFYLKIIGALIVLAALYTTVQFIGNNRVTNTLIFIIASSVIFQSFNFIDFYFQSKVQSKYVVFANMLSLTLSAVVKILLIINNAPLVSFAIVALFESIVLAAGLIYFFVSQTDFKFSALKFDSSYAKELLRASWPLIFSNIFITIFMRIDQVMLKEMVGAKDVGQYAVAVVLCEAMYFFPVVITTSLFPAIINSKKEHESVYHYRLQKLFDMIIWFAIIIAVTTTLLSSWVVDILYGDAYNESASILAIYIWGSIFVFFGLAKSKFMLAENIQYLSFVYTATGAITNIVLNYIFIKKFGAAGCAYATIISQLTSTYLLAYFHKIDRQTSFMFNKSLILPLRLLKIIK